MVSKENFVSQVKQGNKMEMNLDTKASTFTSVERQTSTGQITLQNLENMQAIRSLFNVTPFDLGVYPYVQETAKVLQQTGGTKKKAKKVKKKVNKVTEPVLDTEAQVQTELATVTETATDTVQVGGVRKIRSFKV